jgi:cold shock CspA family protein
MCCTSDHRRHQLDTAQRLQDWTFPPRRDHVMLWAVIGQIKFYDDTTAWGIIQGADGGLYAMRGDQLAGPRPAMGDRVVFEVQPAPGGPRAIAIRRTRAD